MKTLLVLKLTALLLIGCAPCDNEIISTTPSPTGQYNAVVFHRGCGATTGFNTQLSILPAKRQLSGGGGNAVIVDGQDSLSVEWGSPRLLVVTTHGYPRSYKSVGSVGDIVVEYRHAP